MEKFAVFSIFYLLLFTACSREENDQLELSSSVHHDSSYTLSLIRQLGCPDSLIQDIGDHFVADGDIVFPKRMPSTWSNNALQDNKPVSEQAYAHSLHMVFNKSQQLVKLWIDPSVRNFSVELLEAMRMWNNVPGHAIKFAVAAQQASANVRVLSGYMYNPNADAEAQYPIAGSPGPVMSINVRLFQANNPSRAQKIATLAHEMGHLIGFGHTDWNTEPNQGSFLTIPGTPAGTDLRSLMCKATTMDRYNTLALSNYDKIAVQTLYPIAPYNLRIPAIPGRRMYWYGPLHRVAHYKIWYQIRQDHRNGWQLFQTPNTGVVVNIQGREAQYDLHIPICECTIGKYWVQAKVKYVTVDGVESPWSTVFEQAIQ